MMCVGHYEIEPPIYKKFIEKKGLYTYPEGEPFNKTKNRM